MRALRLGSLAVTGVRRSNGGAGLHSGAVRSIGRDSERPCQQSDISDRTAGRRNSASLRRRMRGQSFLVRPNVSKSYWIRTGLSAQSNHQPVVITLSYANPVKSATFRVMHEYRRYVDISTPPTSHAYRERCDLLLEASAAGRAVGNDSSRDELATCTTAAGANPTFVEPHHVGVRRQG